jgi:hypothetical protein
MVTAGVNWIAHAATRSIAASSAAVSRGTIRRSEASAAAASTGIPGFTPWASASSLHATSRSRAPSATASATPGRIARE